MYDAHKEHSLFRVLSLLGGVLILLHAGLNRVAGSVLIDPLPERLAIGLACLLFFGLTYVPALPRRTVRGAFHALLYLVTAWYFHVTYLNALSFDSAFGLVMVLFGCSLGFMTTRALGLYALLTSAVAVAVTLAVEQPGVDPTFFIRANITIGALSYFMLRSRLRLQDQLSQSEALMQSLFEEAPDGFLLVDPETNRPLRANAVLLEHFEARTLDDLPPDLLTPPSGTAPAERYERAFQTPSGTTFWADVAVRDIQAPGSRHRLVRITDITERKRIEELKDEFISVVNHELRTPLTSIIGSLNLIAGGVGGNLPDAIHQMIDIARRNADRLLRLINDMLDIQKIEAGKFTLNRERIPLMPLLRQSLENQESYGRKYGIRFTLRSEVPDAIVCVDPDRFEQVMANLLSNAAKFAPKGDEVTVAVTRVEDSVRVSVTDHGPGIPSALQPHLFKKFFQVNGSNSRPHEGTGLGLTIARSIVEMHGGQIGFTSDPGRETTFYFDLPVAESALSEPRAA